jgi:hypothetical protein
MVASAAEGPTTAAAHIGGYARAPELHEQSRYVIRSPGSTPSCVEPSTDNSAVGCSNSEGGNTLLTGATGSVAYFVLLPTAGPPRGGGGGLPREVDTLLGTDRMQSKLAKLADSGSQERQLFLMVLQAAFSLPVFDSLAWGGRCRTASPGCLTA